MTPSLDLEMPSFTAYCTEGRDPVFRPGAPAWFLEQQEEIKPRRRGN